MPYKPLDPKPWRPGIIFGLFVVGIILIGAAHILAPLLAKDDPFDDMTASIVLKK